MEAKELRIGNYYEASEFNRPNKTVVPQVKQISIDLIYSDEGYEGLIGRKPEDIKPILLTEEWLIKFGFEIKQTGSNNEHWQYVECKLNPQFIIGNRKGYWSFTPIWNKDYEPIKYVHQLQNLYFALTGKELEFK